MKNTQLKKLLSLAVCIVLIAAMALCTIGCDGKNTADDKVTSDIVSVETPSTKKVEFKFTVVDVDGKETEFKVTTDKTTVGEALLDEGLIAGEDSAYGLYVKTVNGITLDYDTDGKYWAFYVDGEYASSGVDSTNVQAGSTYTFKAE